MAQFHWSMQIIGRAAGRSAVAAAAYRSGECLYDERQDITHDYRRRSGVEHKEILLPDDAPAWVQGIDREALWNAVEAREKRKDAQLAREVEIMIPREVPPENRIDLVTNYFRQSFVSKGMVVDVCWHNKIASDGREHPHCHALITMRPLADDGFGLKSRHEWIPDPSGRTHDDGRPIMVVSNPDSFNCPEYFDRCREDWERIANAALERAGSIERIDRRSLLTRGIARLPEPALRLAYYLQDLRGSLKERFGQWQFARIYVEAERRAKTAFAKLEEGPTRAGDNAKKAHRFWNWLDRQMENLAPSREGPAQEQSRQSTPDMER